MKIIKGESNGGRFRIPYRVYGNNGSARERIVCVGGAQQTMAIWRSFISRFSKEFPILVFDPPGHGQAKTLYGEHAVSLEEQIEVVNNLVTEAYGEEGQVFVAAASWGSIIGAGFASLYPHRVKKLLLGSFGGRPSKKMLELIDAGQVMVKENNGRKIGPLIVDNFGQRLPWLYKKKILHQFEHMAEDQFWSFFANADLIKNVLDINKGVDLRKITAPTLIVNGEWDAIIDLEDIENATSHLSACEVKIIPETGHFLHHEKSDILEIYHEFFTSPA